MKYKDRVVLKFKPRNAKEGIPLNLFQKKLFAFQKALWTLGEHSLFGELKERGRLPEEILKDYTFEIVAVKPGSLEIIAKLPGYQTSMFPQHTPQKDLGILLNTIESIPTKRGISSLLPDAQVRKRVLWNLREFFPEAGVPEIQVNETVLNGDYKEAIDEILVPSITEEEREITGPVVALKIVDRPYLSIATAKGLVTFFFPYELSDIVVSSIAKVVTVKYKAGIDVETQKEEDKFVLDIIPMEGNSFPVDTIEFRDNRFVLNETFNVEVLFEKNLCVLQNKELEISAYSDGFEKAWESFQEDFVFLWEEIALEKDEFLEENAKKLKRKFLKLVNQQGKLNHA